jgi:hypothetical protein
MIKQLASNVISGLHGQPLALTLLVINIAFIVGFGFVFNEIAKGVERKDNLVIELTKACADNRRTP